jgi:hypothetical protein
MDGEGLGDLLSSLHIEGVVEGDLDSIGAHIELEPDGEGATGLDEVEGWLDSEGLDEHDATEDCEG